MRGSPAANATSAFGRRRGPTSLRSHHGGRRAQTGPGWRPFCDHAIAAALAQAGTTVVLASRSAERYAAAAARLSARTGTAVHGRACDVTASDRMSMRR
jgi:hypothetical protein